MKKTHYLITLTILILSSACNFIYQPKDATISEGYAKLTGKIAGRDLKNKDSLTINLILYDNVTGNATTLETDIDENGSFHFDVPITTKFSLGFISIDDIDLYLAITLIRMEDNHLEITKNDEGEYNVIETNSLPFNSYDSKQFSELFFKLIQDDCDHKYRERYDLSPDEFREAVFSTINCRLENVLGTDTLFSYSAKKYLGNELKLLFINGTLFHYPESMEINFHAANPKENRKDFTLPPQPERAYYLFLKDLNLDDRDYLVCSEYSRLLIKILSNDTLRLIPIADETIDSWIKDAKEKLSDLVGFNNGLFYDLLASNAYCRQFENEIRPLSEHQIANIKSYWKDNDIAKILLTKNEEIKKADTEKTPSTVKETPIVSKELLMDSIVARYGGKVVLIDFWATWCGGCLNDIKEVSSLKSQMRNMDVVFIYLTDETSPEKTWKEKIKGIGGEHYYLTEKEWQYMSDFYGFTGISYYLLFDKNGKLVQKIPSYPGNEKMKELIESLL